MVSFHLIQDLRYYILEGYMLLAFEINIFKNFYHDARITSDACLISNEYSEFDRFQRKEHIKTVKTYYPFLKNNSSCGIIYTRDTFCAYFS